MNFFVYSKNWIIILLHYFVGGIAIRNITENLLFCHSSPCMLEQARMAETVIGPSWTRKCGFSGNVCESCVEIDPHSSLSIEGTFLVPVPHIQFYEDEEDYIYFYQEASKFTEYFVKIIMKTIPNYIGQSVSLINIVYARAPCFFHIWNFIVFLHLETTERSSQKKWKT